jgi:1,2-diacylglycerol 3-alpha-glucosyltransferase
MVAACPFPHRRGTPLRILQMGDALHRAGYDVHVVTYHLGDETPTPGLTIHRTRTLQSYREFSPGPTYTKLLLLDPMLVSRLARVVRRHRIRWLHAHHFEGALCALLVRKWVGGVRILYDAHTTLRHEIHDYPFFRLPRILKKVASDLLDSGIPRWVDHVVAVSDRLRDWIVGQGVPASKVTTVPMGINLGEFRFPDRAAARAQLGIGPEPLIAYTGNMAAFQGVVHLLQALPAVQARIPDARLLIVGPPSSEVHEGVIPSGAAPGSVRFLGDRPFAEVQACLAAADVLALPRDECVGFPLKLLNYLAAGRCIVAFAGSGGEAIRHLENGFLVSEPATSAFAQGIIRCLEDRELRDRLGAAAEGTALSYSQRELDHRVRALYRRLLGPEAAQPGGP